MIKLSDEDHFQNAVNELNGKNLNHLWVVSSLLSGYEYYDRWGLKNPLLPLINLQVMAMFDHAVLESNALAYKSGRLQRKDIPKLINALKAATSYTTDLEGDSGTARDRIFKLLSKIANFQLRYQEKGVRERLGRTYAFLKVLPESNKDKLKNLLGTAFVDLTEEIPNRLGLSVESFLLIGFAILGLFKERFEQQFAVKEEIHNAILNSSNSNEASLKRAELLVWLIENIGAREDSIYFTAQDIHIKELFSVEMINAYLHILGRSTKELRQILSAHEVYRVGHRGVRLSPLERYPIVEIGENKFCVPNFRYFDLSFTEVLHFVMQEQYAENEYNVTVGRIQEIYIEGLIAKRLPNAMIIPELEYTRKKSERVKGPDLTIIDNAVEDKKALIVVESKAKRMRAATRMEPFGESLQSDLDQAIRALDKLTLKIDDLYGGLKEYERYQRSINSTRGTLPFCLIVMGDGLSFMQEIVMMSMKEDPNHPLIEFPYPFAFMSLEILETAVEICSHQNLSLYDILTEFWNDSQHTNFVSPPVEKFRNRSIDEALYTKSFADELFKTILNENP